MSTRVTHRLPAVVGLAALSLLLSSCTEPGPALGPLPASSASTSADVPATPTTGSGASTAAAAPTSAELPSAEKQALAEATGAVTDYYAALDRINSDPSAEPDTLHEVATGDAYLSSVRMVIGHKGRRLVQTGNSQVVDVNTVSIDLTNAPPGRYPTVVVDACLDVSAVDVEDTDGKSVVRADRLDQTTARLDVVHYDFGWRVNKEKSAGEPCAP